MSEKFKPLKKEFPFGDRIAVDMRAVDDFIVIPDERKLLVGTKKNILEKFALAYSRGDVVDQADAISNFSEWPNQGVVVGVGTDAEGVSVGDTIHLRNASGVNMKLDGRVLRVIRPQDIYVIRHDSQGGK